MMYVGILTVLLMFVENLVRKGEKVYNIGAVLYICKIDFLITLTLYL